MKLEHPLIPYTKINSKWFKDLNIRPDSIKLLKENKIFFEPPPRVTKIKIKVNKWNLNLNLKASTQQRKP